MENQREASQLFWLFVVLVGGAGCGFASDPPVPRPVATLALSAAEDVNREDVQVFDTVSGKPCVDWHRDFPATFSRVTSAAIAPSGEFVAFASENTLSIYRLPTVCQSATVR
jgi:hypothetical protein